MEVELVCDQGQYRRRGAVVQEEDDAVVCRLARGGKPNLEAAAQGREQLRERPLPLGKRDALLKTRIRAEERQRLRADVRSVRFRPGG